MSLRAFHFVFIIASILLCAGLGVFGITTWQASREPIALGFGIGAAVISVVLVVYGVWFARKSRKIIL